MVRNLVIATVDRKKQPDRSVPHVHLSTRGAEADPAPLGQDSGFPLTRGPFEVIIASHGVIHHPRWSMSERKFPASSRLYW
jgi:hypothetical protein